MKPLDIICTRDFGVQQCDAGFHRPDLYATSSQHKDSSEARIKRDASDLEKIRLKLAACSPFTSDPTLRNIVNGIVAGPDVNVHDFESVGNKIIEDMIGKSAFTYKFKRND